MAIEGAHITGGVEWSHDHFNVRVALVECVFDERMDASGLRVDGDASLERSTFPGVDLSCARFDGKLILDGIRLNGPVTYGQDGQPKPTLNLNSIKLAGELEMAEAWIVGETALIDGKIDGELNCNGAKLYNAEGDVLSADRATITASVSLSEDFEAWGMIRFIGSEIGGQLCCSDAKIHSPNGNSLSLDGAKIDQDVFLDGEFSAEGTIRLVGAEIGGQLCYRGAKLRDPKGPEEIALFADRANINENVYLDGGFKAEGTVRLIGTEIGGQLVLKGAKLHRPGQLGSLRINRATINGDTLLHEDPDTGEGFFAEGLVSFSQSELNGNLSCGGANFSAPDKAFEAEGLTVVGRLEWNRMRARPNGKVDLREVHVGQLWDDPESWPMAKGALDITGFTYDQLGDENQARITVGQRLAWIRTQTGLEGGYALQPYLQLADVYQRAGRDRERRRVLMAKQDDFRSFGEITTAARIWNHLLGVLTGHGYQVWRAVVALLVVYLCSVGLVWG